MKDRFAMVVSMGVQFHQSRMRQWEGSPVRYHLQPSAQDEVMT